MRKYFGCLVAVWFVGVAFGWLPPVDTAGALTARIQGPETVTAVDVAQPVVVALENRGDAAVKGSLRLRVVDAWRAEPAGAVPFSLKAHETLKVAFKVTAGKGTYSALYPIHAYAAVEGQTEVAHPILIVAAELPAPPQPEIPAEWTTVELPRDGALALWRLRVHRTVVAVFGKEPRTLAPGWQGVDAKTRAVVQFGKSIERGDTRQALVMHPPYQGGPGTILQEFPLRLPERQPIVLTFSNAVRDSDPGGRCGDGVTFRVRALPIGAPAGEQGEVLFERHTDAKVWQDERVDLGRFAGKTIRLQLESHPGPRHDTGCDSSYWAEPWLAAGNSGKSPATANARAASRLLGILEQGGVKYEVRLLPGGRGLLDSAVTFESGRRKLVFQGFRVRVLGDNLEDRRSISTLAEAIEEPANGRYRVRHRFRNPAGSFDLLGELWAEQGVLRVKFWLENAPPAQPWQVAYLEDVATGAWNERAERVYAGDGNVLQNPQAFKLTFDGHRLSTSFVGFEFANGMALTEGVDAPPSLLEVDPARKLYTLHTEHTQMLTFIPSGNVWDGPRRWHDVNGLKAAGGVRKLAGRFVFDLWHGTYAESARDLERAFRYGLTDSAVVWHSWQRWGYDYRLPEIYPPNPKSGTIEEFLDLVRTAKRYGVPFAPHDNYIDLYPDAEAYTYDRIAFNVAGAPEKAWLNKGREAQSYRWRPDAIKPFVESNLRLIKDGFAPTGYFIDVWSSAGPYDYWTKDGKFFDKLYTRGVWRDTFAWIRGFLGDDAPTISESGHDQLIGWLDGGQTNHLRVDAAPPAGEYSRMAWPIHCGDAERIPWFDAAHHDRFALHGAGYENRYLAGLDAASHGVFSDDYIATEVLDGHPAMVQKAFSRDVVRKYWLLHDLMRELALRRIEAVEFEQGNLHRQHVRWDNGVDIWVNRGAGDWKVEGHTLPQYGFYARWGGSGDRPAYGAGIERRNGVVVEWSRSAAQVYVNARLAAGGKPVDFDGIVTTGALRFTKEGDALQATPLPGGSRFAIRARWSALPWRMAAPRHVTALDENGKPLREAPFRFEGGEAILTRETDAFAYKMR
jgi:hypothetical protein